MTKHRFAGRGVARALLLAALIASHAAHAQVTLNFVNADIDQVAKAIGVATGRTIIVDPRVKGQLNLVSEQSVPEDEALKILQSALRMQGFALVQDHGILKVVPEAEAKLQGVPTYVGNQPRARGDQVITQVFQLHNESANNLLPVLRPLISPNNTISAYPANNTLVVTDYADNVRRIASIIAGVDTAAAQQVDIVPLKNASAVDLASQLGKLLDPGAIGSTDPTLKVTVTADPRTNSLLLRASNEQRLRDAKMLIAKLDAATHQPGNIHVVALRNADANQLAKTLRAIVGQGGNDSSNGGTGSGKGGSGQNGLSSSMMGSSNASSTGTPGLPPLPGSSSGDTGANPMGGTSGNSQGLLSNKDEDNDNQPKSMIQADTATNSLIITASDPVFRNLRNVIEQLDVRRPQVYIESLIVEVSANTVSNLGIQWQGGLISKNGNNAVVGGTNFGTPGTNSAFGGNIVNLTAAGYGLSGSSGTSNLSAEATQTLLNQGLNIGVLHKFGNILGLGGLLNALAQVADTNVLSTPNVITLNNEEAKIIVGQNVPVLSGSYATPTANSSSELSAFSTYNREDVGITLNVKPQITEGGVIKMQIYQEDSSLDQSSVSSPGGVIIDKRAIQSTVLADDGQIIVLGGLIQDNYASGASKIPWLGDIPVIGGLFRSENKNRTKTNLMVFLRPVIVRDSATASAISLNRYDYERAQTGNYQSDNWWSKDKDTPELPPAPPGPQQGVAPAQGVFDWSRMTRRPGQPPLSPNPAQQPPYTPYVPGAAPPAPPQAVQSVQPTAPLNNNSWDKP